MLFTVQQLLRLNTRHLGQVGFSDKGSLGDDTYIRPYRSSHRSQVKDEQTGEADMRQDG